MDVTSKNTNVLKPWIRLKVIEEVKSDVTFILGVVTLHVCMPGRENGVKIVSKMST